MTADELAALRRRRSLTQAELADWLGYDVRSVRRWEAGSPIPRSVVVALDAVALLPGLRAAERRYRWLLDRHRPRFIRAEALAILGALNGIIFPDPEAALLLWATVEDAGGDADLVARLSDLSAVEAMAVVDAVERFWQASAAGEAADDALAASGLVHDDDDD